ncbi:podocalyxin-like protein 2 [Periophthalmus magnuspinnatus]|uniref:podocalyxin-like protein 2 n=1 Tax=Periophthalmus magnuspinnatus TaxID=409849 RepID=UPI002436CFDD|nr:podocalyxin-like protein 2 [Periophthalmus magnuspinnatus]
MLCTAADMKGLHRLILLALVCSSSDAFRLDSSPRIIPLSFAGSGLDQDQDQTYPYFVQELVRARRQVAQELVRAQPHLVHDMGWPEIHETTRTGVKPETSNHTEEKGTHQNAPHHRILDDNLGVKDEMERMVHLAVPQDPEDYQGPSDPADPESELTAGPGAGDTSLEASGFYGTDTEDRTGDEGGEEGGEERERRGGEEWDREAAKDEKTRAAEERAEEHEVHFLDDLEVNHTSPDLDSLIGYSSSLQDVQHEPSISNLDQEHDSGLQEHRASPVLEVSQLDKVGWETEDSQSSGYGSLHSSSAAANVLSSSSPPPVDQSTGTPAPETDTGTDFGLLVPYGKDVEDEAETEHEKELQEDTGLPLTGVSTLDPTPPGLAPAPSRGPLPPSVQHEEREGPGQFKGDSQANEKVRAIIPLTIEPTPTVGFTEPSWDWLENTSPPPGQSSELARGGVTEVVVSNRDFGEIGPEQQVVCIDWTELAGRGYVVLNMTKNLNCEEFRAEKGVRLLRILERVFARRMNSPEGSWVLYLSKPVHQQRQLLMNVASEQGVIATKDVLDMLGEIRKSLDKVGIQNYSSASSCQARPSQTRSDYGKLFVVLVIIGSVCTIIITSGFIYICWQRRLPAKTTFRAEELHFVENACHDNPTLDVTNDNQGEMQEKKPSANGLQQGSGGGTTAGGGGAERGEGAEEGRRWQVFVNQAATEEEEEEQDTHL